MSRPTLTLVAATIAALLAAPSALAAEDERAGDAPAASAATGRVIVEWAAGASPARRRAARAEADVAFADDLGGRRFQLVETTAAGQAPRAAVRELEADPAVVRAAPDRRLALDAVPDDPLFGLLWGLRNTGLGVNGFSGAVAGDDIDALGAWEWTVGTPSTIVADIDSGYRFEHPDLADVVWTNPEEEPNGLDDDGNGIVDDVHGADFVGPDLGTPEVDGDPTDDDLEHGGHGVHTAGTIGAEGNNGVGITGVAQDVSLMPLRVCSKAGDDDTCLASAIVAAIEYAGAHGARVANMSLGGDEKDLLIRDAIAANPEVLFAISAGNDGVDNAVSPHYPCVFDPLAEGKSAVDNVVCVAATDQADGLAWFSNWGQQTVDLGAPGTETLSTYPVSWPVYEDFEAGAAGWSVSGADGGFARTGEAPLTSYGLSDSPGAAPVAGSVRASTLSLSLPAGFHDCDLQLDRTVRARNGGRLWVKVDLDGEALVGVGTSSASGHYSYSFGSALSGGGELDLRLEFEAGTDPAPSDGAWVDDVGLHCTARLGEPGGYAYLQGTSMATPHVTGAAALLFSLQPSATVAEVRQALLGSVDPVPSLAGRTTSGGRLDAAAALDFLVNGPPPDDGGGDGEEGGPTSPPDDGGEGGSPGGGDEGGSPGGGSDGGAGGGSGGAPTIAPAGGDDGASVPPAAGGGSRTPATRRACRVPKLAGRTLPQAKRLLRAARCRLGRVTRPRPRRGRRPGPLVVRRSFPGPGARPASARIALRLGPKPRRGHKRPR